ncbi:ATP synthase F1 subunit gamma [Verrucomicrobium sp. BvORR034]|jgi:F-type H+-transporting ATPase subunit gamma|uniref:ATP synthase F1 subunit gamma n=1 Tax=Verrucomicrobium sp. BvORR034 TaxID=1396418 RepID=UPI000679A723|nr:ATP synthase F1 subunit gamma [Verrucomicrobium sp. BvORR034]
MPSTRDIRRRIKSVKNTAQITKAMQLVAASKMKRAQDQALAGRSYAELLNKVLVSLKDKTGDLVHPLLEEREGNRELILVVSTDKGLCGGLNTNLLRKVIEQTKGGDVAFITVGSKLRNSLGKLKKNLVADFGVKDPVKFAETRPVSRFLIQQFLDGKYDRVKVAFTNFVNVLRQEPLIETVLPVSPVTIGKPKDFEGMGADVPPVAAAVGQEYLFEPNPLAVFDQVLPQYIDYMVYQMILEARASEHSSRMVAMKSATDNAKSMIKDLTLEYNKLRQASITNELLEITTAMKALE